MIHKVCPACGEHPIINTETSRPPTASCNNIMCAWAGIGIHLEDWDAPRPLEESLLAEIESLKARISELEKRPVCHYPDTSDPCAWTCMNTENSDIVIQFDEENMSGEDIETAERMGNLIGCMFDTEELVYLQPYDEVVAERDEARAELEAYKQRRCETCGRIIGKNSMWCAELREYMRPEQFCSEWEPQDTAPLSTGGQE